MFRYSTIQPCPWAVFYVAAMAIGLLAPRVSFADQSVDDEINKFVEKETEILKSLGDKLETDLRQKSVPLHKSDGGINPIRATHLDDDITLWSKREELPKSDESAEAVVRYVLAAEKQKIAIENFRKILVQKQKSNKAGSNANFEPLDKISDALDKTLASADKLGPKSEFWGTRQNAKNATQLHLIIKERTGATFTGDLEQGSNGNFDRMKVAGKTTGTDFFMETTGMINGASRHLRFSGKLLGGRIECEISGIGTKGKPTTGNVSLYKKK